MSSHNRNLWVVLAAALALSACKTGGQPQASGGSWPRYVLENVQTWRLNLPGGRRFDASALAFEPDGNLLTLSDQSPGIYRIVFHPGAGSADLQRLPEFFTPEQMAPFAREKIGHYDCEGLAVDARGRLYVSEESNRWILRFDRAKMTMERLEIDFRPVKQYFDPTDLNASFEGVAVNGGTLYVANERKKGRIITVDLAALKVTDDFCPRPGNQPFFDVHFSDLCWFKGSLYALLREDWVILKLNPATHAILAEYNYQKVEDAPDAAYHKLYPFVGVMEGLAVDDHDFWMVTDNNGLGRVSARGDTRPTLFKCPRPDL